MQLVSYLSLLHLDNRIEHLIHRRNDLRVCLEAALGDDHVGKLVGQVYIGLFQIAGADLSQAGSERGSDRCLAGVDRRAELVIAAARQIHPGWGSRSGQPDPERG